jgi:glycosyltransferase involved in cell wall biosynthesis
MKVLFLTLARIENIEAQGIYSDLLRVFRDKGHQVTIVNPLERKFSKSTSYYSVNGVNILNVWTTNIQKTNFLEKGFTTLFIELFFYLAIKKYLPKEKFDLILYSTPPITFTNLISKIKENSNAKTYLLLKDIFPQNAVDLNVFKKQSLIYKYFRKKEKLLYDLSDFIGCMSPANLNYVLKNNPTVKKEKVEINPNSIEIKKDILEINPELYEKYKIPNDKVIFIFGGNLGIPQGIDLLKKHILFCKSIEDAFFLIVGNGTEYTNLNDWIQFEEVKNAVLIKEVPKNEFEQLLSISHVGLILLNPNFTIPNFPSRILSYMQDKLPVICATDKNTDIGKIAIENNFGFSCLTTDLEAFFDFVIKLLNPQLRDQMGQNAFQYLQKEYSVEQSYNTIINKFN